MPNPDAAQKALLSFNDVFADVVNARIFAGKQVVEPDALEDARANEEYYDEINPLGEYERDVVKIWGKNKIAFAILGLENQNRFDPDMVFRMAAYDALSYRAQMKRFPHATERCPVISLLLYFGDQPWTKRLTLRESITFPTGPDGEDLAACLAPFFNDYKLNLVDVGRMPSEEIALLRNDFKMLVGSNYQLLNDGASFADLGVTRINHEEETLRCLREMYGAGVAETARRQILLDQGEVNMTSYGQTLVQNLMDKGHEIWFQKGVDSGRDEGRLLNAREAALRLWKRNTPVEEIAEILDVSPELVQQWLDEAQKNGSSH